MPLVCTFTHTHIPAGQILHISHEYTKVEPSLLQRDGDIILLLLQIRQGHVDAYHTEFSTPRIARGPGYLQVAKCFEFILCCF
jgi:hypothetical protein